MIRNVIYYVKKGRIKLCDFGYTTKHTVNKNIDSNDIIGTLEYLSP